MVIFWVFTVCGGFTRSIVIFQKLFSQCNQNLNMSYLLRNNIVYLLELNVIQIENFCNGDILGIAVNL